MDKQQRRAEALMPNGVPRYVRCYDKADEQLDRYTIVFTGRYKGRARGEYTYVGSSSNPFHPQGFYQHGGANEPIDFPTYSHLGKKIAFSALPEDVKKAVLSDYRNLWNLKTNTNV